MADVEPLPDLPPIASAPSAWQVCPFCGAVVADLAMHRAWHQDLVNRVRTGEDAAQTQQTRTDSLAVRVAALDNGSLI